MTVAQWWILAVSGFLVGGAIGSFGCVVIERMPLPLDEPNEFGDYTGTRSWAEVVGGESRCSSCGNPIRWVDKIPIVSWFMLKGRCRGCGEGIPGFHPVVELAVPIVLVTLAVTMGVEWRTVPTLWLAPVGIVLSVIDLRTQILPTKIIWPAFFVAVMFAIAASAIEGHWAWMWGGLLGILMLAGPLMVLWFALPGGMGFGDVRLATLLGFTLGFSIYETNWGLVGFFAAALLLFSAIIGIAMGIGALISVGRKAKVPFGPALVLATLVLLAVHEQIIDGFQLAA